MLLAGLFIWALIVASMELFVMGMIVGFFQKKFLIKDVTGFLIASLMVTLFLLLGFSLGIYSANFMPNYTSWYAATVLLILGLKMFYDGIKLHKIKQLINPLNIKGLMVLSTLAGLNIFFIGLVFGLLQITLRPIYLSFLLFLLVILLGHFSGFKVRKLPSTRLEFLAGLVYIVFAILITIYF